jgi:hypothetical protein
MKLLKLIFKKDVEELATAARYAAYREKACTQYIDLFPVIVPFIEINPRNGISMGCDFMILQGYMHKSEKPNAMKAFQRIRATEEGKAAIAKQAKYRKEITQ